MAARRSVMRQARDNLYLGGKTWAAYVALEHVFNMMGAGQLAGEAGDQAEKASHTMANAMTEVSRRRSETPQVKH